MRRLAAGAVLALTLSGCGSIADYLPTVEMTPSAAHGRVDRIDRVIDGDTVDVAGGTVRIRLLGIDSPETKHPGKPVECGGPESSAWAAEQLPVGSEVRVEFEPGRDQDNHARVLAYVMYRSPGSEEWLDFSVESARAGMSRNYVYDGPVSRQDKIEAAESEARNAGRGFWGHC